jgi:UDP-N-acetylglucosamine 2-epimerase (non-hydrolysing)/GDP/UDP-N,N'-diacetylbacillosamine 2-epimerase (hydrolysing)
MDLESKLGLDLSSPTILVAYHPVTINRDTLSETGALFEALDSLPNQILFCFPNVDAGSRSLIRRTKSFVEAKNRGNIYTNLNTLTYLSLLGQVEMLVGNSSSGIMEAASFSLPVVNVGLRQQGRERARNVIDVEAEVVAIQAGIQKAMSPTFRKSLIGVKNPYGDGCAAEIIVRVLSNLPSAEELLMKRQSRSSHATAITSSAP